METEKESKRGVMTHLPEVVSHVSAGEDGGRRVEVEVADASPAHVGQLDLQAARAHLAHRAAASQPHLQH